ncbi:phosphoadenosine phosphosulfate reductase family protein [Ammoniphilus resinae]|uniref:3'-phosphoadenosine 5'-phosphosulfate sulfotransferase (PAPS reductase)/FAD synthetase n=1 Tax=Ammoniphilus resinae TaxID=861532 RepID=A0ABS4GND9_9BACL|nr:phosphoadenosine phosphosulfate reductase family protein [Ammoniphilus resinae]MBP1931761.1 3'-phosphoadenosine 5'-phosphosulfate sulfotransferase (PAPS reductase)/FAD synthetase [Ammoniphilus resinae]
MSQLMFTFEEAAEEVIVEQKEHKGTPVDLLPLEDYDHILISESAGKDSMACLFHLQDIGVDMRKVELYHQSVDGGPDDPIFMDWPCTESYLEAVGQFFGIPVRYQWRDRGFKGELLRKDSITGDVYYYDDSGNKIWLPSQDKEKYRNTRLKWPALSSDLRTRWCSAAIKIDVFRRVLSNHPKFKGTKENPKKVLVVTGERREESFQRSRYLECELHSSNCQTRLVHAWRPVIDWKERDVWDAYEKRRFLPLVSYQLGWNRTSCFSCIFSTPDLWAMLREIAPERFQMLVEVEKEIGHTIDPKMSLTEKANLGSIDRLPKGEEFNLYIERAFHRSYRVEDLIMEKWHLPAGAFRRGGGPN